MAYFGTDGIRGPAYEYITKDLAFNVGRAMGLLEKRQVILCRDTRESGHMIVDALKAGIIASGLDVLDIDIHSTPVLAYHSMIRDCFGIMVTASHNPYQDNGIKVFNRGRKTTPEEERVIEEVIDGHRSLNSVTPGKEIEFFNPLTSYMKLYDDVIVRDFRRIVLDLANGATIKSAKHVFNKITDDLEFIGDNPDGKNINEGVGSTHLDHLKTAVKEGGYDLGFAFDGDGDRVLTITKEGHRVDGDMMIYIFARYLKIKGELTHDLVVLTKMSNPGIIEALEDHGIQTRLTDIGDKYVIRAMDETGAILGGENSGHVINKHLFISGDGVLNAAFLIKILHELKTDIETFLAEVRYYPDRLENLRGIDKSLVHDPRIQALVKTIERELDGRGKVLVRPSGTEPLIRISASAKTKQAVDDIVDRIATLFKEIQKEKE